MSNESPPTSESDGALTRYREQLAEIDGQHAQLKATDAKYGTLRVILFFISLALALLAAFSDLGWTAGIAATAAFAAFFLVVVLNEPIRDRMDALLRSRSVVRRLIARLGRDWDTLATSRLTECLESIELPEHQQAVADDLDLLGRASLFHLVSMAATMPGIRTLARWLANESDADAAQERTEAINALAPRRDERMRFYALAREVGESTGDPDQFVAWASREPWLDSRRWLSTWANVSVLLTILCVLGILLAVLGIGTATVVKTCGIGLIALAGLNMLLTSAMLGPAHQIFSIAMSNRQAVDNYHEIFAAAQWLPQGAAAESEESEGCLSRIRRVVLDGDHAAIKGMDQLQRVAAAGGLRQSAATFLLYLPLQAFGLWDVRVLKRLEDWQSKFGPQVRQWFDALGELEALLSLAAIRDEYPQWATPQWKKLPDAQVVRASAIGHPLLSDESRVTNDVEVGPPGTILLVTGSNMSGKSTMLRSVGLNVALAGTGAPVCASHFELPSVELATSIRVRDNLSEGVSFYMAELQRLKSVVDQARQLADVPDRVVLFLLDEILQGTNSRERQIAVVQVLRHLRESGAIGAISTHDLELADEPEMMSIATPVHFRETIRPDAEGEEQMTFDYQMRDGVSPTTNALRLLEMVGLGENDQSGLGSRK
ncbi:DNA mismatch repair protein MutS [Planctomycetes bacterium K23_9]|uniref:DNA mismatch repair protein MutS n=2 Tax=Stieleria marina TaxID=1930275 RepID=A0A517P3B2_9BACT|nr:DNA mismatch repair protein MutS [Planctomycetes bacterium K23_9]